MANTKKFAVKNGLLTQNIDFVSPNEASTITASMSDSNILGFNGDLSASALVSSNSIGDEGGEIRLNKAVTNTTLTTGVTIDVYQNKLRIFETGGSNRGLYFDLSGAATSVGTNGLASAAGVTSVTGTAPIVSSGGVTPAISISAATASAAGSMSAADKTKLDGIATGATANTGTVTSVGLSLPTIFSVTGSPVTTSGTLTATLASQTANTFLAAPNGTAGAPTMRAIVAADIPTLNQNTTGSAGSVAWNNVTNKPAQLISEIVSTSSLAAGWYTIAVNAGDRASAKFIIADQTSSLHQTVHFYASHHFGSGNNVTVVHNDWYGGGGPIRYIRIKENDTYQGAMIQIYLDSAITGLQVYMYEDVQSSGFTIKNFVADGTDPGGLAAFASLTNVAVQVDLDSASMVVSDEIFIGGATTQYKALHAGNYNSYSPTLTGTGASGTWGINISGNAANVTGTVAIANGGTGQTSRQAAMDALAGATTAGQYLRGDGTDVVMSAIQATDVPTLNQNTTGSAATLTTGRTIGMTGDVTWTSASFNGSGDVTGTATLASIGTAGTYTKVTTDAKGRVTSGTTLVASDIPSLDASKITSGVIDAARLPSYVDDVTEAANLASFPATGETGKIYVALDTNKTYRWSGSAYVFITSGAVDSVAGKTGVVTLVSGDVGLGNVENKSSATIRGELTSGNVTTALGFTPYNATNPSGYTTNTGTVTSIATNNGITGGTITTTGTIGLTGQALALHNLATNGVIARTGFGTVAARTITAGTAISVTNGDGVSGNPTITNTGVTSISATSPIVASASTGSIALSHANSGVTAGTYNNVTVNATGHVTAGSNVAYLTGYTETDTLATVTGRGATTATAISLTNTGTSLSASGSLSVYQAITFGNASRYSAINTTIQGAGAGDKLILFNQSNYDARMLVGTNYDFLFKSQGNAAGLGSYKFYSGPSAALAMTIGADQNVTIAGSLFAASKSFLINHPTKSGKKLLHGSLEGPEHGVYVRGKLKGKVIELPEYWTKLVDADSITVQLTAIGKGQKLYVEDIRDNKVYIANDGMFASEPNCFYLVQAERIDIEKMEVEI